MLFTGELDSGVAGAGLSLTVDVDDDDRAALELGMPRALVTGNLPALMAEILVGDSIFLLPAAAAAAAVVVRPCVAVLGLKLDPAGLAALLVVLETRVFLTEEVAGDAEVRLLVVDLGITRELAVVDDTAVVGVLLFSVEVVLTLLLARPPDPLADEAVLVVVAYLEATVDVGVTVLAWLFEDVAFVALAAEKFVREANVLVGVAWLLFEAPDCCTLGELLLAVIVVVACGRLDD